MDLAHAKKALVLLHGRGGTAAGILGLANEFCDESFYVVAPEAPNNAWYPYSFMVEESDNEPKLSDSIKSVKDLIDQIAEYVPHNQIYLMGFSQGACLSLEIAARFATTYGGIIAFTGGLIGKELIDSKYQGNFEGTKIFIGTSENDPHIPLIRAEESKKLLQKLGADVTLKVYPGFSHTITQEEIDVVKNLMFK